MILLDANILLYAYVTAYRQHEPARRWLERALARGEQLRLCWPTILAFIRISTNPRLLNSPFSLAEAIHHIDALLAQPSVAILVPTDRHWSLFRYMLLQGAASGDLSSDAHVAALAVEHDATVATADRDFARFPRVRTLNPLA